MRRQTYTIVYTATTNYYDEYYSRTVNRLKLVVGLKNSPVDGRNFSHARGHLIEPPVAQSALPFVPLRVERFNHSKV